MPILHKFLRTKSINYLMIKKNKRRGKNQKKVMDLLRDPYYVEISLRRIASEVLGTPMYTDTQYDSIRKTVNQLENDKKLIESITIPLFSKKIWDVKGYFPRGLPSHLRMVRIKCSDEWHCKDGITNYGEQIPKERYCKI